jgi:glycosyltransferase involved in cell wall biosynthesis
MTEKQNKSGHRVCVVIPTYNNSNTIAAVIRETLTVVPDIIVVNDGSTDGTKRILEQFENIDVLTHSKNLGKGVSLSQGLAYADEKGFTHAISIDADGQHSPGDIQKFVAKVEERPQDLIIGVRNLNKRGRRRLKSRLLRGNSNFWVWIETGRWIADTQSGFRAYPVKAVQKLLLKSRKYDYEIEVLVKLMWFGLNVSTIAVAASYGRGSKSHFRPLRDFAIVSHLNACLIWQRILLPGSLRRVVHLKEYRDKPLRKLCFEIVRDVLLEQSKTPASFALCIGLGVCFGILPIWGLQMLAAGIVAHQLRLSKPLVLAASNISIPVMIPLILYVSVLIGQFVLRERLDYGLGLGAINQETVWMYAAEYLVGSVLLAIIAGFVALCISYVLARGCTLWWKKA